MNTHVPKFAQCATAGVVDTYAGLAISPDGRQVYAGSYPGGIAAFARDRRTDRPRSTAGTRCLHRRRGGRGGRELRRGLGAVWTLAISPDGKNV